VLDWLLRDSELRSVVDFGAALGAATLHLAAALRM